MYKFPPSSVPRLSLPLVPGPGPVVPLPPQHIPKTAWSVRYCNKLPNGSLGHGEEKDVFQNCKEYVFSFTYSNGLFISLTDNGGGAQMRGLIEIESPVASYAPDRSNVILKTGPNIGAKYVRLTFQLTDPHALRKIEWIASVCNRTCGPHPPEERFTELGTLEEFEILNYYGGKYPHLVPANFYYDANDNSAVALRLGMK